MTEPLTDNQLHVLWFVADYEDTHGRPPLYTEIRAHLGHISMSSTHKALVDLREVGLIDASRPHKVRNSRITDKGREVAEATRAVN